MERRSQHYSKPSRGSNQRLDRRPAYRSGPNADRDSGTSSSRTSRPMSSHTPQYRSFPARPSSSSRPSSAGPSSARRAPFQPKKPGPSPIPPSTPKASQRINKYIADHFKRTRKEADMLVAKGLIYINGKKAELGQQVFPTDTVSIMERNRENRQAASANLAAQNADGTKAHTASAKDQSADQGTERQSIKPTDQDKLASLLDIKYVYLAYNKPEEVITHSAHPGETDIKQSIRTMTILNHKGEPVSIPETSRKNLFPIGRLDKKSHGLIILTNDGRITDRLLNPINTHEKEYIVETRQKLPNNFKRRMESGVQIGGNRDNESGDKFGGDFYTTKKCEVKILGDNRFSITLVEGKKHQIRRMCEALRIDLTDLKRTRIMNIRLGKIRANQALLIEGTMQETFLKSIGL